MPSGGRIEIIGIPGIKEAAQGDVVASLVLTASRAADVPVRALDIVVVAQKLVSKAEGHTVQLSTVSPGAEARRVAIEVDKDPRVVEVILSQSRRIVRLTKGVIIVETHHGFICANAGIDASNVPGGDVVTLLPPDPDGCARRIRDGLESASGRPVAVIVSDSFNRPWREGSINVALGVAGMAALHDQRGEVDDHGRVLRATVVSVADEVASAAQLVMGEARGVPVAIVRGLPWAASEEGSKKLLREAAKDLFRQ